jgi:hypothetical protein
MQQLVVHSSVDAHVSAKGPPPDTYVSVWHTSVWHEHSVILPGRALLQVAQQNLLVLRVHFSSRVQQYGNATSTVWFVKTVTWLAQEHNIPQVQIGTHRSHQGQVHL